jgi:hypothetical protein
MTNSPTGINLFYGSLFLVLGWHASEAICGNVCSVSSLAWFMSMQEITFVTIGQRVLARPLKVRMHYGHSDVFDRLFHISRGGISKASKQINLSSDTFTGSKRELSAQCFLVKTQILSSKEKHLELGVELFLVSLCEFLEASLLPQYRP